MTRSIFALFIISTLCGCSPMMSRVNNDQMLPTGRSLWQLTIGNPETPRFTGLLALRESAESMDVVLLDSTGIKLLSERIESGGEIAVQSAVQLVKEKGLPEYLGNGLYRIFQFGNGKDDALCSQTFLLSTCFGEDTEGRLVKSGHFGPFQLWSVEYFIKKESDVFLLSGITLKQGWLKPDILLKRMKQ